MDNDTLVQVLACRLFGDTALPEPMMPEISDALSVASARLELFTHICENRPSSELKNTGSVPQRSYRMYLHG